VSLKIGTEKFERLFQKVLGDGYSCHTGN